MCCQNMLMHIRQIHMVKRKQNAAGNSNMEKLLILKIIQIIKLLYGDLRNEKLRTWSHNFLCYQKEKEVAMSDFL